MLAAEHRMARTGDSVLVGPADHLWDLVEVEHGWRRRDLPFDRVRPPGIRTGEGAAYPARDHVVEEDHRRRSEHERRDRDDEVEIAERGFVVEDAARHAAQTDPV